MQEHVLGLGHVAVYTRDIEESIRFYAKLGGEVKGRGSVPVPEGEKRWRRRMGRSEATCLLF